jgi:hypothetical protein
MIRLGDYNGSQRGTMKSAFFSRNLNRCILLFATAMLASLFFATAQTKEVGGELQQYQWTETTQMTLKGDAKPPSQSLCQYGPNGQVQKTPIGTVAPAPSGGRIKQRVVERKKEEMQDYMGQVKTLLAKYVPPDPQKMEQAFQAGNASLNPNPGAQTVALVFKNYAQPGDQMTLSFAPATRKVSSLNVNTYMDDPKNVVTLAVQMASLPDGTNYVQQTVLDATAKKLQVTTTNFNYKRLGGQ